jgi:tetratricopeptide (TPR) repeat protein
MGGKGRGTPPTSPTQASSSEPWDAFISHTSANDDLATRLEENLQEMGLNIWVDHSDLRRRGLLLSALQEALLRCAHLVLLWSQAAEQSRYVTAEWNFAWNREISILPCRLDQTLLPLGLAGYLYCDFRTDFDTGFSQLEKALRKRAPREPALKVRASETAPSPDYQNMVREIYTGQDALLTDLGQGRVDAAAHLQARLEPRVEEAVRAYPEDAYLLSTAGYQKKNAYLIKYWPQIQARQSPQDPLLGEAEERFWKALQVRPDYPAALNGLGSILWLRGDLDAAEFFVQRALERAREEGLTYSYAEEDLKNIRREKQRRNSR